MEGHGADGCAAGAAAGNDDVRLGEEVEGVGVVFLGGVLGIVVAGEGDGHGSAEEPGGLDLEHQRLGGGSWVWCWGCFAFFLIAGMLVERGVVSVGGRWGTWRGRGGVRVWG